MFFPKSSIGWVVLDLDYLSPDFNRSNNTIKTEGSFKRMEPLGLRLLPQSNNYQRTNFYLHPIVGWNSYDRFLLGLNLHNLTFPNKSLQFSLFPYYSIHSESLVGFGQAEYQIMPNSQLFQKIRFGLELKSFSLFGS